MTMTTHPDGRRSCVGCGISSPHTDTGYTLISSTYGWRLYKRLDESGRRVLEWRCPACWEKFKKLHQGTLP